MIKSVVQLKNVPMPFTIENILTARVDLPKTNYPDVPASIRFFEQLLPRLQSVPGVEAATLSDGLPAAGNGVIPVQIEGKAYQQDSDYPLAREGIVTAGYFDTFQTTVLSGREFRPSDTATSQPVAVINQSFARTHFPNIDPIGHQMRRIRPNAKEPWLTIVGVVPDLIMFSGRSPTCTCLPVGAIRQPLGRSVLPPACRPGHAVGAAPRWASEPTMAIMQAPKVNRMVTPRRVVFPSLKTI